MSTIVLNKVKVILEDDKLMEEIKLIGADDIEYHKKIQRKIICVAILNYFDTTYLEFLIEIICMVKNVLKRVKT